MSNSMHTGCSGCKWYLGDGCCRINAEGECREGGGFELFEAAEPGAEAPGRLASAIRFCPMCGRRVEEGTV